MMMAALHSLVLFVLSFRHLLRVSYPSGLVRCSNERTIGIQEMLVSRMTNGDCPLG
jgi:hypothetical protein